MSIVDKLKGGIDKVTGKDALEKENRKLRAELSERNREVTDLRHGLRKIIPQQSAPVPDYPEEAERLRLEKIALDKYKTPPVVQKRETMSDEEQRIEVTRELHRSGVTTLYARDVKAVQDATERVISKFLPEKNIRIYGLGTFSLVFKDSKKYNPDPYKILKAGLVFIFKPSKNILKKCDIRGTVDIREVVHNECE